MNSLSPAKRGPSRSFHVPVFKFKFPYTGIQNKLGQHSATYWRVRINYNSLFGMHITIYSITYSEYGVIRVRIRQYFALGKYADSQTGLGLKHFPAPLARKLNKQL